MKNNETGEFELVLGNKQLLSGFFIVVILFGVFFAMGYIVGRNSTPSARLAAENAAPPVAVQPDPGRQAATGGSIQPPVQPAVDQVKPAEASAEQHQPSTQAAREPQAVKPEVIKPERQAPVAAAPAPEPQPGETYLQVTAVKRPEAEVVMKVLKDKGFPATLSEAPNGLTRVLVGPYKDAASLGAGKTDLANAGFPSFVRK
jgi:cell division septation protein DedD